MESLKSIENKTDRSLDLFNEITKLKKERDDHYNKIQKEIDIRKEELDRICPHIEKEIKYETEEGDYYNKTRFHKITYCKVCSKKLNDDITVGSFG
jgi:t-SNARE complex subunit (syntaxin)